MNAKHFRPPRLPEWKSCTGCAACSNSCPKNAIEMKPGLGGFLFPTIDGDKCIRCGRCESTCPVSILRKTRNSDSYLKQPPSVCFAAQNNDSSVLFQSSSGGVAAVLENEAIAKRVVVYGAVWNSPCRVAHQAAETVEDCQAFRQSKYIQSDIGQTYTAIQTQLDQGRRVLFFGTPCQIKALYAIIGRRDNLATVSFYCHGVISPKVFAEYIHVIERKIGLSVTRFNFRNKTFGWHPSESCCFAGANDPIRLKNEWLLDLFLKNVSIRPSCLTCKFRLAPWNSDITLSDFWEWHDGKVSFRTTEGLSKVFVNTPIGVSLWNEVRNKFDYEPIQTETTEKPVAQIRPVFERAFHKNFDQHGIEFVLGKYPTKAGNFARWIHTTLLRIQGKIHSVFCFPRKHHHNGRYKWALPPRTVRTADR